MEKYLLYLVPVIAYALLTAGWMAVQLLARKAGTKNHIDHRGGCCGACDNKDTCTRDKSIHPKTEIS